MFANLRLRTKLALGFLVPVLFLLITGFISVTALQTTYRGLETVYRDRVVPLRDLKVIADKYAVDVIDAVNKCNAGMFSPADALAGVEAANAAIRGRWSVYLKTDLTAEEAALVEEAKVLFAAADADIERLLARLRELGDSGEGQLADFDGGLYASIDPISGKITELIDLQLRVANEEYEAGRNRYERTRWLVLLLALVSALVAGAVGYLLARNLIGQLGGEPAYAAEAVRRIASGDFERQITVDSSAPSLLGDMRQMQVQLQRFIVAQAEMSARHGDGDIDFRIDAGQFPGAYGQMADSLNALVEGHIRINARVVELLSHYAIGELSQDMEPLPGQLAATTEAMATAKRNLQAINRDIQRLVGAAASGDFSARGEEQTYQHAFREMVAGLNRLMREAESGLSEVGEVLAALAKGDLSKRVERKYEGAFGRLAVDANTTSDQLGRIVSGIKTAAESIYTAAGEIAAGNADLSTRTEQQAANLEETASSMEELTSTVRQNAENARQANQLAVGASEVAVKGGAVVSQVVSTMDSINASSQKIVDIIAVIDGIAFQTNILALNAAVEAARAGEQGRGFAVVASEVRALAQRSASAAKEIKTLIDDSVGRIGEGSQLVDQAGATMSEIVT
ncbi:MAG TPA: methyl-accepting chemotaxis protein, partial [Arenimonas sp.]|nr:methyl-accepting chemotaxis protein [Arenimonas sp.]